MMALIKQLKGFGIEVKIIGLDNAGENVIFAKNAKDAGLGIKFEFTPTRSPQCNGKVERWFATMFGRVRAILNQGKIIDKGEWAKFAGELMHTVTQVENTLIQEKGEKSSHEKFWRKEAPHTQHLRIPLEIGIASNLKKKKAKLDNRGEKMTFLGHADDHAGDVCQFWNPKTGKVIISRDVRWTNTIVNHTEPVNNRRLILKESNGTTDQETVVTSDEEDESGEEGESESEDEPESQQGSNARNASRAVQEPTLEEEKEEVVAPEEEQNVADSSSSSSESENDEEPLTMGGQETESSGPITGSMAHANRP